MIVKTNKKIVECKGIGYEGKFLVMYKDDREEVIATLKNEEEAKEVYKKIKETISNFYKEKGELIISIK